MEQIAASKGDEAVLMGDTEGEPLRHKQIIFPLPVEGRGFKPAIERQNALGEIKHFRLTQVMIETQCHIRIRLPLSLIGKIVGEMNQCGIGGLFKNLKIEPTELTASEIY